MEKNTGILYNRSTFFMPKVGGFVLYTTVYHFRQIAVIKIVKFPPPPTPKKKYLPTYLPYLELIIQYVEENHIALISVYTSDITVFIQYCRLCLFYNVIFIYLHVYILFFTICRHAT